MNSQTLTLKGKENVELFLICHVTQGISQKYMKAYFEFERS
jgi:hypothetical protein